MFRRKLLAGCKRLLVTILAVTMVTGGNGVTLLASAAEPTDPEYTISQEIEETTEESTDEDISDVEEESEELLEEISEEESEEETEDLSEEDAQEETDDSEAQDEENNKTVVRGPFTFSDNAMTVLTKYAGTDSEVVIPDSVTIIDSGCFQDNEYIRSVTFSKYTKLVSPHAFQGCINLREIKNFSTCEITQIGYHAFYGCRSLKLTALPASLERIDDGAFYQVPFGTKDKPIELVFPATLKFVGNYPFDYDKNDPRYQAFIKKLTFEDTETSPALELSYYLIPDNNYLEEVVLPNRLEKLPNYAFQGDENLKEVKWTSREGESNLKLIGYQAFYGCRSLKMTALPASLERIEERAFYQVPFGTKDEPIELVFPSTLKFIGDYPFDFDENDLRYQPFIKKLIFEDTETSPALALSYHLIPDNIYLEEVVLPNRLEQVPYEAFRGCTNLKEVKWTSREGESSIKYIGHNAFYGCSSLKMTALPAQLEEIGECAFYQVPFGSKEEPVELVIPATVKAIGNYVFTYDIDDLKHHVFIKKLIFADDYYAGAAKLNLGYGIIQGNPYLESVVLPNRLVEIPSYAFQDDVNLKEVKWTSREGASSLKNINYQAFLNCYSLQISEIPESVEAIEENAFYNVPFGTKENPVSLVFSENIKELGNGAFAVSIADKHYAYVKNIVFNESDMGAYNLAIGFNQFSGYTYLESITFPARLESWSFCFEKCTALKRITVQENRKGAFPEFRYIFMDMPKTGVVINCIDGSDEAVEALKKCFTDAGYVFGTKNWKIVRNEVSVSFVLNGHGEGVAPSMQSVSKNTKATKPENPVDEEYRFDGWFKDSACTVAWDFENDVVKENIVLYAKWTPYPRYSITVNATTNGTVTCSKVDSIAGKTVSLVVTPAEGYMLASLKVNGGQVEVVGYGTNRSFVMPEGNVEIQATFIPFLNIRHNVTQGDIVFELAKPNVTSYVYTGEEIRPAVKATFVETDPLTGKVKKTVLKQNVDYVLMFSNNIGVTTSAEIYLRGIGEYDGFYAYVSDEDDEIHGPIKFSIEPLSISKVKVDPLPEFVAGAGLEEKIQDAVHVFGPSGTEVDVYDYKVLYSLNGKAKTAEEMSATVPEITEKTKVYVYLEGQGNYKEYKLAGAVTIYPAGSEKTDLSEFTVTVKEGNYVYNGKAIKPQVTVTNADGVKLKASEYTLIYKNNVHAGDSASVEVYGKGKYTGKTGKVFFEIKKMDISKCKVTIPSTSLYYNGERQSVLDLIVTYQKRVLVPGEDYRLEYSGDFTNVTGKENKPQVKIIAMDTSNDFTNGTKEIIKTFKINKARLNSNASVKAEVVYNGNVIVRAEDGMYYLPANFDVNKLKINMFYNNRQLKEFVVVPKTAVPTDADYKYKLPAQTAVKSANKKITVSMSGVNLFTGSNKVVIKTK